MQLDLPVTIGERLGAERRAFLQLLGELDAADWPRPTACAGWSVHDVVTHVWRGELGLLSRLRDNAPGATLPDGPGLAAALNARNQQWAEATVWLSPAVLIDMLRLAGEQADAFLQALNPQDSVEAVSWAASGGAPNWLSLARHFTERWHHQQHVRDAVGMPGLTDGWMLSAVVATFVQALPAALHTTAATPGTVVRLHVSGDGGGAWEVVRADDTWHLRVAALEAAAAEVQIDAERFWRLCTKGITAAEARVQATLAGDATLAQRVFSIQAIIA